MAEQDLKATKKEVSKFIIPELSHLHLIPTSSFFLYLQTKQNIEEMIEALLEEEFPAEEDEGDIETEELATNRLEIGIKERFVTQETNLSSVMVHIHKTKMSPDQFYLYFIFTTRLYFKIFVFYNKTSWILYMVLYVVLLLGTPR